MLLSLRIQHLAIVDDIELEFGEGFNVLTGETGAGKSIILEALHLLFGKRAQSDVIRRGHDGAVIEGIFQCTPEDLPRDIIDIIDENGQIIISRIIRPKRQQSRINGVSFPLKQLRDWMHFFVSISGQHDQLKLLDNQFQLSLLDSYAGSKVIECKRRYSDAYATYHTTRHDYEATKIDHEKFLQERDFIQFQYSDISSQSFIRGEDNDLRDIRKHYRQAKKQSSQLRSALDAIHTLKSASDHLTEQLSTIDGLSPNNPAWLDKLNDVIEHLSDDIESMSARFSQHSTTDINQVEERLDTLFKYKSKYRVQTVDELLDLQESLHRRLNSGSTVEDRLTQCLSQLEKSTHALRQVSLDLYHSRKNASKHLNTALKSELHQLAFDHVELDIKVTHDNEAFSNSGSDTLSINISLNKGMPPQPLAAIASGGELSRVILAIRRLLHTNQQSVTLIFDEVDAGVGGETALAIGNLLSQLAKHSQLLCITHLPQIAHASDHHFFIQKMIKDDHTVTTSRRLSKEESLNELKRMVGGKDVVKLLRS